MTEGNSGTVNARLRGHALGGELEHGHRRLLDLRRDGATAGGDYAATTGTLTFAPGQTARRSACTVNGDTHRRGERDLHGQPVEPVERDDRRRIGVPARSPTTTPAVDHDRQRDGDGGEQRDVDGDVHGDAVGSERSTVTVDYATADGTRDPAPVITRRDRDADLRARRDARQVACR